MFMLHFVLLAHLAVSTLLSGSPVFVNGRWMTYLDNPDYYDVDEGTLLPDESMLPENSSEAVGLLPLDVWTLQTTPESYLLLGQDSKEVHDSRVWKIVVITAVLLVSLVGCLGTAYYFCIWRGGRIHYMPQKTYA
ncbi:hypothetical protein CHARACLAT_009919 [Characodon lateralis]|uniref:Uncharacterized protein n=1 Tax=Characodon lateralis TaxID=208331 RepID=A0ABU7CLY2_9TELE|nr:hypothetical protein [Characodon lateralis]